MLKGGHMANTRNSDNSFKQDILIDKINYFLKELKSKEKLPRGTKGLCGGFSNMLALAMLSDKENDFIDRMKWLANTDYSTIINAARLYSTYLNLRQKRPIEIIDESLFDDVRIVRPEDAEYKDEESRFKNLSSKEESLFKRAQELYVFINTLLFSQDAENNSGMDITSANLDQIAKVIMPVEFKNDVGIHKKYEFSLNMTESELEKVLGQVMISNNELVTFASHDHLILIKKKSDKFIVYDPNEDEMLVAVDNIKDLNKFIINNLFKKLNHNFVFMPISFQCFSLSSHAELRPNPTDLLEEVLKERKDKNIDIAEDKLEMTSLRMAVRDGHYIIAKKIIENGADVDKLRLMVDALGASLLDRLLRLSIESGDLDFKFVKLLFDSGASPKFVLTDENILHKLANQIKSENISDFSILLLNYLKNKFNNIDKMLAQKNGVGKIPLEVAIESSNITVALLFLEFGNVTHERTEREIHTLKRGNFLDHFFLKLRYKFSFSYC